MTNSTTPSAERNRLIVIHNVAIPSPLFTEEVIAPDLEAAWKYYPSYLFRTHKTGKALSPAGYLMEVLRQAVPHDDRNRISEEFAKYLGKEFLTDLETFHNLFTTYA